MRWRLKSSASRLYTQPFISAQIKESITLRVTGLCVENSPVTGEFPTQTFSNAENVSIWWREHFYFCLVCNRSMAFLFTKSIPISSQHRRSVQNTVPKYNCCCGCWWCQYAWRHNTKTLFRLLAFLRRTHESLDSPLNGPEIRSLDVSFIVSKEKPLNKESSCQGFDMEHIRRHPNGLALDLFSQLFILAVKLDIS